MKTVVENEWDAIRGDKDRTTMQCKQKIAIEWVTQSKWREWEITMETERLVRAIHSP